MIKFKKILTALTICLVAASATAADSVKIRLWVGWAPGGPVDIQARILQKHILMYQPDSTVIVEYHPGANGGIGLSKFTRHTEPGEFVNLYIDTPNILISKFITKTNKVDLLREIRIGTVIGVEQMLIMTSKQSGINSIHDLRSSQKSVINYGSSGIGSLSHLTTAYIESVVKQDYNHIPFRGSAPVFPDLISSRLDMFSVFYSVGLPHVLSQQVNAIAITGKQRNAALPHVPTLEEQGIKNYPLTAWTAIFVNNNDNPQRQQQAIDVINKTLIKAATQEEYANRGIIVDTDNKVNPDRWWQQEIKNYRNFATLPQFQDLAALNQTVKK